MRALNSALIVAAAVVLMPLSVNVRADEALSTQDRDFAIRALAGNQFESQAGTLAQQQGDNKAVRQFGERMVADHGKARQQLTSIAGRLGLTVPSTLPSEQQKEVERLSGLRGLAFDTTYGPMMLKDHNAAIDDYRKEVKEGANIQLKDYAQNTLPTLEEHLKAAREIANPARVGIDPQQEEQSSNVKNGR